MNHAPRTLVGSLLLAGSALIAAPAGAVTVTAYDSGTVSRTIVGSGSPTFSHDPANTSASIGVSASAPPDAVVTTFRSYALFNIPTVLQNASAAVLQFDFACFTSCGTVNLRLSDISSAAAAFQVPFAGSATSAAQALYADLGDGANYGGQGLTGTATVSLSFTLGAQALASLSSGFFGVGFTDGGSKAIPGLDVGTFSGLSNFRLQVTPVPEPATTVLWAVGALALGAGASRRRTGPTRTR